MPMTDTELARRAIVGAGELIATLGRWGVGPEAVVRRPDALGARVPVAADNPWFDAVFVPLDAPPPAGDPLLPGCVWTVADAVPGREEDPEIATPCMGLDLADADFASDGVGDLTEPSLKLLGDMNERAYDDYGVFGPLVSAVRDPRVRTWGLQEDSVFVCVALSLTVDDDFGIHFVATEAAHRRRGLASRLLRAMLVAARAEGLRSATLSASEDGLSVYQRLGFRQVATLRGFLRPDAGD